MDEDHLVSGKQGGHDFLVFDHLSDNLGLTDEGYLVCRSVAISRAGVFDYAINDLPEDIRGQLDNPGDVIEVERPVTALNSPETIASFLGKPVTFFHPEFYNPETGKKEVLLRPLTWKESVIGTVLNVAMGDGDNADKLYADLQINEPEAIELILGNKIREVSAGAKPVWAMGSSPGRVRQVYLMGNHVALVQEGRCGAECAIVDHATVTASKKSMKKKSIKVGEVIATLSDNLDIASLDAKMCRDEDLDDNLAEENKNIRRAEKNESRAMRDRKSSRDEAVQMKAPDAGMADDDDAMMDEDEEELLEHEAEDKISQMEMLTLIRGMAKNFERLCAHVGMSDDGEMEDEENNMMDESEEEEDAHRNHETEHEMENKEYRENQRHDKELTALKRDLRHERGVRDAKYGVGDKREERHLASILAPGLRYTKDIKGAALRHSFGTQDGADVILKLLPTALKRIVKKHDSLRVLDKYPRVKDTIFRGAAQAVMGSRDSKLAAASYPMMDSAMPNTRTYNDIPEPQNMNKVFEDFWSKNNGSKY